MFVIRPEQLQVLRDAASRRLPQKLYDHVAQSFPREVVERGEERTRAVIRAATHAAKEHGFHTAADVARFVDTALALGEDFHREPWAAGILASPGEPRERMRRLVEAAIRRLYRAS